jgi:NDP-sugar pyrophosphorylase family protein
MAEREFWMRAVILAGGLGTRLRPFTEVIPKPLLPLGEQALMEVQIHSLKAHGVKEIFVATNYKSQYIEAYLGDGSKYDVKLTYSCEDKQLGTAGPLSLLKDKLTEPFLVMNGDILTRLDFTEFYRFAYRQASSLTIATKIIATPFRFGNVTVDDQGYVTHIEEKPEFKLEILAGIYCLKPSIFEFIPDDTFYGMDTLIQDMLAAGERISRHRIMEYWLDIGQVEDYSQARDAYFEHFSDPADPADPAEAKAG